MLAIKLQRVGRKHQPSYRIVVAKKRSKMASPPVEQLGFYDPSTKEKSADADRVKHWIGVGAKPTPTVHNMLIGMGILSGKKIAIKMKKLAPAEVEATVATTQGAPQSTSEQTTQEQTPVTEEAKTEPTTEPAPIEKTNPEPEKKEEEKPEEKLPENDKSPEPTTTEPTS